MKVKPWTITWADHTWTDSDVTGGIVALVVLAAGRDEWSALDPWASPSLLMSWLIALETSVSGDLLGARDHVAGVPFEAVLGALSARDDD